MVPWSQTINRIISPLWLGDYAMEAFWTECERVVVCSPKDVKSSFVHHFSILFFLTVSSTASRRRTSRYSTFFFFRRRNVAHGSGVTAIKSVYYLTWHCAQEAPCNWSMKSGWSVLAMQVWISTLLYATTRRHAPGSHLSVGLVSDMIRPSTTTPRYAKPCQSFCLNAPQACKQQLYNSEFSNDDRIITTKFWILTTYNVSERCRTLEMRMGGNLSHKLPTGTFRGSARVPLLF